MQKKKNIIYWCGRLIAAFPYRVNCQKLSLIKNYDEYNKTIFNKNSSILAILIICFLLLRLSLLLTDIKHLEMDEEAVCGVLANEVMSNNIRLSILDYQHVPWCGDTLVVSFVAIPFFLIFGNSIISLKLIPLCFSLGRSFYGIFFLINTSAERLQYS